MNLYKSNKVRFISGFILIIVIYSVYYIYFLENKDLILPSKIRHVIKFGTTIAVYLVGTFHLGKLPDKWMSFLWHMVHVTGLVVILSLGFFDWFICPITLNLRVFAGSVQEILISPLLYIAMGLLNRSLNRKNIVE